jgi:hypothetical protein
MLDYLIDLVGRLGRWGYLVIFFGAALETAAFLACSSQEKPWWSWPVFRKA